MSAYDHWLPTAFPYCLVVSRFHVPRITELLASADHIHRNGSSFAVTVDADLDTAKLWLSAASLNRLRVDELWSHHFVDETTWRLSCD